jgi:hypothetical protein
MSENSNNTGPNIHMDATAWFALVVLIMCVVLALSNLFK